jgi:hypothetical protein
MSRFNIRGQKYCDNCKYYRMSKSCGDVWRCILDENVYKGTFGTCYHCDPKHKNWNNNCVNYKEGK